MRLAPLLIASIAAASPALGQGREDLASLTGVSRSDVSVSDEGRIRIRGDRLTLEAERVLATENVLILENAVFSAPGRGRLIIGKGRGDDPAIIGAVLDLPLTASCAGEESALSAPSVVMEADADGALGAAGPERLIAADARLRLVRGEDCFGVAAARTGEALTGGPDGSVLTASATEFFGGHQQRLTLTGLAFASPEGVRALTAETLSFSYADDERGLRVSANLTGAEVVPSALLYPDLLTRLPIRDPAAAMRIEADVSVRRDAEGAALSFSAHADRVGSARLSLRASGDPVGDPMSAALISASGGFRDDGGFALFQAVSGHSVPEAVRGGIGLPEIARSDRFAGIREAVAGWLERGQGEFTAEPAVPLNAMMAGASFLFGPTGLSSAMNLDEKPEFTERKP